MIFHHILTPLFLRKGNPGTSTHSQNKEKNARNATLSYILSRVCISSHSTLILIISSLFHSLLFYFRRRLPTMTNTAHSTYFIHRCPPMPLLHLLHLLHGHQSHHQEGVTPSSSSAQYCHCDEGCGPWLAQWFRGYPPSSPSCSPTWWTNWNTESPHYLFRGKELPRDWSYDWTDSCEKKKSNGWISNRADWPHETVPYLG